MTNVITQQVNVLASQDCAICGRPLPEPKKNGPPRIYCSDRCRARAVTDRRRANRPGRACRGPLPDFAKGAAWSLRKDVERLERIFADDRFPQNKPQVAAHLRGHLKYAAEVCQDLLSRLDNPNGE